MTVSMIFSQLYGWGSSKYGQVGQGTRHVYTRPMLIEEMSKMMCIAIDCGQYHSVTLTDEGQYVYIYIKYCYILPTFICKLDSDVFKMFIGFQRFIN